MRMARLGINSQLFGLVLGLLFWLTTATASAEALRVVITKNEWNPLPIAIPVFINLAADSDTPVPAGIGGKISNVVVADLERSGLFLPLARKGFLQNVRALWEKGPYFGDWRKIGADAVVRGAARQKGNQLLVDLFLYDVYQGQPIGSGKRFSTTLQNWRDVAHKVADEIYTRLTGEKGYFRSRIAFVAQEGKQKWLALMDQDGANRVDLTKGRHLVLTPRFSPNGEHLFYLSYETGASRIFRWDIYSGKRAIQTNYPGLNSAPSWSPDGRRMALTLSKDGNPEIYLRDLQTNRLTRLTRNRAIDTSPSWSPDGKRIVFNSNRGGSPQLYVMDVSGGKPKRITFKGSYNAAPSWSPRGDWITFVKGGSGKFRIAVIKPNGKRERILTDSWMDESPAWSPNGRVILFSRQKGNLTKLYTIDITGKNERALPVAGNISASDPSWSPLVR